MHSTLATGLLSLLLIIDQLVFNLIKSRVTDIFNSDLVGEGLTINPPPSQKKEARSSPIKAPLPLKVIIYQRLSSVKWHQSIKVIFHQSCPPPKFVFTWKLTSLNGHKGLQEKTKVKFDQISNKIPYMSRYKYGALKKSFSSIILDCNLA